MVRQRSPVWPGKVLSLHEPVEYVGETLLRSLNEG